MQRSSDVYDDRREICHLEGLHNRLRCGVDDNDVTGTLAAARRMMRRGSSTFDVLTGHVHRDPMVLHGHTMGLRTHIGNRSYDRIILSP